MPPETTARAVWELVALGTGGTGALMSRSYPSLLLKVGGHRTLIDVGDGALRQLAVLDGGKAVDAIVLTALSTERIGGLPTLLDNQSVRMRNRRPVVYGPPGTADALQSLSRFVGVRRLVDDIAEVDTEHAFHVGSATGLLAVVDEGPQGPTLAARITEPDVPGRFDVEAAKRLGVPPGPAYSALLRGETVSGVRPEQVVGPARPSRRLTVLGPCRPTEAASNASANALGLFVVAPYTEERQEVAVEGGVMTGAEAALLATAADVDTLALLHLSTTARVGYARREAAQFHQRVLVVNDGDAFGLPVADDARLEVRQASRSGPGPRAPSPAAAKPVPSPGRPGAKRGSAARGQSQRRAR